MPVVRLCKSHLCTLPEEKAKQDVINAKKRKKRKIWTIIWTVLILIIGAFAGLVYLGYSLEEQEKAEAARKQAAIEQEKAEADRKAALEKAEADRKAALIEYILEEIKKLPVPKFRWGEDVETTRYAEKRASVVQEFYRTKGAASFVSSLRESAGFKYGLLATYSFPSEVIFEKISFSKIKCTEVFASGEERTVTFNIDCYNDYLIKEILINGIKFDLNKSLDDLL